MALHRLTSVTMGVPDVDTTAGFYADFGLTPAGDGWFSTRDGGRQLHIVKAPTRRLVNLHVGVDDQDDLDRAASGLRALGAPVVAEPGWISAADEATGTEVYLEMADRLVQAPLPASVFNGPGRFERLSARAPSVLRDGPVQPRKLGHAVLASPDWERTRRFFVEGIGFKVSDQIKGAGAFLRCSTDHHNLLVLGAPMPFLHHTSWEVADVDEVGAGAQAMLEGHPDRHVWGLGRHYAGSNFFWYLKDPAGNFSEYYSDLDCIVDDQLWTPQDLEGARGLYAWGPPPPPSFLNPEDLAEMMTATHSPG